MKAGTLEELREVTKVVNSKKNAFGSRKDQKFDSPYKQVWLVDSPDESEEEEEEEGEVE